MSYGELIQESCAQFQQYPDRAWGIIYTKPWFEKKVIEFLEYFHFPCYLPLIHERKSKYRTSHIPMFRGYLFAAWNNDDRKLLGHCQGIRQKILTPLSCDTEIIRDMKIIYRLEELSKSQKVSLRKTTLTDDSNPVEENKNILSVTLNIMGTTFEATVEAE